MNESFISYKKSNEVVSILYEILEFNQEFVESEEFHKYRTTKYPDKRIVILSCMDTRLTELLPQALNLRNGDAKIIKNAGAVVAHPFGSIMRSIIVAVHELNAAEVLVIGHHGCGMSSINPTETIEKIIDSGISRETISLLEYSGIDLRKWLHGFDCVHDSVKGSVDLIRNHPLIPKSIAIHGLVIDPDTGKLELIVDGFTTTT
jgi:carbonic anhydrase